mmetsp:Transcript_14796/g.17341  ORF Transcript_14796/g.17341 Transcript_14796/m.17341 type:complete len:233 (+) Transcript_14796:5-703(+)
MFPSSPDRRLLINRLRTMKVSHFIEVRSARTNTSGLISNILEITLEDDHKPLVELLEKKSSGMPLIIRDALLYYKENGVIKVKSVGAGENKLYFREDRFEKVIANVPQPVEAICGMILDNLSITGQIALKIASMIHFDKGYFSLEMIKKIFYNPTISTENMRAQLDEEWERDIVASRTIMPKPSDSVQTNEQQHYEFEFEWMRDSLRKRMLSKQKEKVYKLMLKCLRDTPDF